VMMIGDKDTVVGETGARYLAARLQAGGFPGDEIQLDFIDSHGAFTADHFAPLDTSPGARAAFWKPVDQLLDLGRSRRFGRSSITLSPGTPGAKRAGTTLTPMGDWYSIGVFAGLGVALGVAGAGVFGGRRYALAAPLLAAVVGVALGIALADAPEAAAAGVGGVLGGVGALELVRGALGRGGTPLATALLVLGAAVVVAGLAFVPVVGYVELVAVPALGMRLRKRAGKRYAGLRTLARD